MNHLATIEGFHKRAVVCLAFSPDGNKIASVGLDDNHSIAVYEWKLCRLISSYKGETYRVCNLQLYLFFKGLCSKMESIF